jgi:hypothetical protein
MRTGDVKRSHWLSYNECSSVTVAMQSLQESIDVPTGAGNFFPNKDILTTGCEEVIDGVVMELEVGGVLMVCCRQFRILLERARTEPHLFSR